jgi:hypothetical protein
LYVRQKAQFLNKIRPAGCEFGRAGFIVRPEATGVPKLTPLLNPEEV